MDLPESDTMDVVSVLLISLQRACQNLTQILNSLDANVDLFERLLTRLTPSIRESASQSSLNREPTTDDFYERLCDEQLEPPESSRATTL